MATTRLAKPLKLGNVTLQHRLAMAPLTRMRVADNNVPLTDLNTEYYEQRASVPGTFLLTEATLISAEAGGYPVVPGIWSADQIAAWKSVTAAVHAKKSFIFCQLWALGRVADADYMKAIGYEVKAPSPIAAPALMPGQPDLPVPGVMTKEDIKARIADYAQAAKNAIEAGFDGVEIHGANGYLIDQFLQDVTNTRTDEYGGSIENRSRFGLEVAAAVVDAIGADKVAIRLSPWNDLQGMRMAEPIPQFTHFIEGLKKLNLAYLHLIESRANPSAEMNPEGAPPTEKLDWAINTWDHTSPVLVAGGFKAESAKTYVDEEFPKHDVVVVFGRYFISTPDLPFRVLNGIALNEYDRDTFYMPKDPKDPKGYTDYPFSKEWLEASKSL